MLVLRWIVERGVMMVLLCKRYYTVGRNYPTNHVDKVEAEFKTHGLVITQKELHHNCITINHRGMKKLYEELKKRFEK